MSREPIYGELQIAAIPSEVRKIWYTRDAELPELPRWGWSWQHEDNMDRVVLRDMLTKILTDVPLSDREQLVVGLYVIEDYTLKEIGKQLAVSKERVNQIYKRAMRKLRSHQQSLTGIKVLSQDCEVMTWQRWKIYKQ